MSISETESLATLELLVAIARADGTVEPAERDALEAAFAGASLPSGLTLAQLLEAPTDVDAILRRVTTPEARERAFEAAFTLAKADGECAPSEQAILLTLFGGLLLRLLAIRFHWEMPKFHYNDEH
jgi:tellurite resistance protein